MSDIKINDLNEDIQITEAELNHVKGGGIALLLPAVQKVRESAASTTTQQAVLGDGSVKTLLGDGSVKF